MGLGAAIFLVAVGAILTWAVDVTVSGIDIHMVGVILMIVGLVGAVMSLMFWSGHRRTRVIDRTDDPLL